MAMLKNQRVYSLSPRVQDRFIQRHTDAGQREHLHLTVTQRTQRSEQTGDKGLQVGVKSSENAGKIRRFRSKNTVI